MVQKLRRCILETQISGTYFLNMFWTSLIRRKIKIRDWYDYCLVTNDIL
jgi:hypothetical protein